ncbi:hypothetical protein HYS94_01780 [Candidatus Daviesbacteria bacterium]|nr:hypothetical protein [Candidatus Daviesbacteria bacterium]
MTEDGSGKNYRLYEDLLIAIDRYLPEDSNILPADIVDIILPTIKKSIEILGYFTS